MAESTLSIRPLPERQSRGLRQAASTVFVLTAVLPLLILTYTLYRVNAIHELYAQVGLLLALCVAVLGFVVFRAMMAEVSDVIEALGTVATKREALSATSAARGSAPATAVAPPGSAPAPAPVASAAPLAAPKRAAETTTRSHGTIAGLGQIRELGGVHAAIGAVWQREASAYVNREVLVSLLKARPIVATLVKVTAEGLLLEQEGAQLTIDYRRLAGIEPHNGRAADRNSGDSAQPARPRKDDAI